METRNSTSRIADRRPSIGDAHTRNRLDLDLTGLPPDMEVVWVRETILGQPDDANIEDAVARGMVPATTDVLPRNKPVVLPGREPPANNLIRRGGMIAMMAPKAVTQAQRAAAVAEGHEQVASAQRLSTAKGADLDGVNFVEASQVVDRVERSPGRQPTNKRFAE